MNIATLRPLLAAVQTNCDITDARFAADLPLCIYLLQLREYYRWERGLGFGAALPRAALGNWLKRREARWEQLAEQPLQPVPCPDGPADAFDEARIDAALRPLGLGYGAGALAPGRPLFFVAERAAHAPVQVDGEALSVRRFGRELARGLASPPAALAADGSIVLRDAALSRWLWEHFEAYSLRPADGAFGRFAQASGVTTVAGFVHLLPALLAVARPVLLRHEMGERRTGQWLGPRWARLHEALADHRRAGQRLRAVRDHLADLAGLGGTLPALLEAGAPAPLHFWFAGYEGQREALFPGLKQAYAAWHRGDGGQALRDAARLGERHFRQLAGELLEMTDGADTGAGLGARLAWRLDDPSAVCGS